MTILDLLKGKTVNVMTDAKVVVQLVIESVTENKHWEELEPATRENDWWPTSREWTTVSVKFTNGFTKTYDSIKYIDIVNTTTNGE